MAKNTVTGRTMDVVMGEIKVNIDKYNLSKKPEERNALTVATDALIKEYNEMSLLTSYASFMAEENPMLAFAKAYTYPTIAKKDTKHKEVKNGLLIETVTRVLDTEKVGYHNIKNFLTWVAERAVTVTASNDWVAKMGVARDTIIHHKELEYAKGEDGSKSQLKKALQGMIDALIVIPGEKGGNALVVTGKNACVARDLCVQGAKDFLGVSVAAKKNWEKAAMALLHLTVTGKEFSIVYGDAEPDAEAEETQEEEVKAE